VGVGVGVGGGLVLAPPPSAPVADRVVTGTVQVHSPSPALAAPAARAVVALAEDPGWACFDTPAAAGEGRDGDDDWANFSS